MTSTPSSLRGPFIVVTTLFFMWGFITVMVDAFVPRLKDVFELNLLQAGFVQFAWFAAYGILSIPGGNLIERIGYKKGILGRAWDWQRWGACLFYPAAETRIYVLFLLALFVVAGGITILQVAANPYISVLGAPESASSQTQPGTGVQLTGNDHCAHRCCELLARRSNPDSGRTSSVEQCR